MLDVLAFVWFRAFLFVLYDVLRLLQQVASAARETARRAARLQLGGVDFRAAVVRGGTL